MRQVFVAQSCLSLAMAAALALGPSAIGWAEEVPIDVPVKEAPEKEVQPKAAEQEKFPDRFMIRGGWNYVFKADSTFSINGQSGLGATVDSARNLGLQREDNLWRIEALYRFNPRHSIGFSHYDFRRKGIRTVDQDLTIKDVTYAAGGTLRSEINIGLNRFMYNYSFHHDEKVELGVSGGLYFASIDAKFQSNLTCTGGTTCGPGTTLSSNGSAAKFTIPLPTMGFLANYHITPRLHSTVRFDWFYIEMVQFKGSITEAFFGLEYRLFKHFAMGTAFDRIDLQTKISPKSGGGFSFQSDWNTLFFYGALYF